MPKFIVHSSWFIVGYLLGIIALFFYSFTQVDLSLTLSRASWIQDLQKSFQYIGYFNRPLSTYIFIGVIVFLYFFYIKILLSLKQISSQKLWVLILFSAGIATFAYNAFSYDLFNYIFDAKIFTYYQLNPYEHKALDFAQEPMLSFMRWTHRVYPYGLVWLGITIPLSYVGFQYFLVTFLIFKIFMAVCFLGTVWCIGKILQKTAPSYEKLGIAFFALNPFVIIESLVSAHNDIVMIFFMMVAIYMLTKKKYIATFFFLVLSYGVKFASPEISFIVHSVIIASFAAGLFIFSRVQKSISLEKVFIISGCLMIIPIVLASLRSNFQPWYILLLLPFAALLSRYVFIVTAIISLSFIVLLEYVPFLYLGNWDAPVPQILFFMTFGGVIISVLIGMVFYQKVKKR